MNRFRLANAKIASFEILSGTTLDDVRFAVYTSHRVRVPSCRGMSLIARQIDDEAQERLRLLLKERFP